MKTKLSILCLTSVMLATPGYAAFSLNNSNGSEALSTIAKSLTQSHPQSTNTSLITSLTQSLNVSSTQATGGVGSMLSYAKQALPTAQSTELTSLIPGMDAVTSSISQFKNSSATDMVGVGSIFSQLGMDASMTAQFAPIILKYLTGQGASTELISSLTSLWQ